MKIWIAQWFLWGIWFISHVAFGLEASFEPIANNTIYEDNPSYASGQSSYLFAGPIASGSPRRSLLKFDLSGLPVNARITSATLTLSIDKAARNSDAADPIAIHRIANAWGQGTSNAGSGGSGVQASADDATWGARFFNMPPTVPSALWSQAGGDFSATPSNLQPIGTTVGRIQLTSTTGMTDDVQHWLTNPAANHGWVVMIAEGTEYKVRRFYGRNAFAAADRPQLTVAYELIPLDDHEIPMLSGWAMLLMILGLIGIAKVRR